MAYDVDEFDSKTNRTVVVREAPLNEVVLIPEFDSSKKEVEVSQLIIGNETSVL